MISLKPGTELVELDDIDVSGDPVRPELTLGFRIQHDRKIFGLKYENEIEAIICVHFVLKYLTPLEKWLYVQSKRW